MENIQDRIGGVSMANQYMLPAMVYGIGDDVTARWLSFLIEKERKSMHWKDQCAKAAC